jgi:hypothetical protein
MTMTSTQLAVHIVWAAAGQTRPEIRDLAARFQEGTEPVSISGAIAFFLVAALLCAGLLYLSHLVAMRDGGTYYSSSQLFRELCQLHELDWPSRRLLKRLAEAHELPTPARLFLEPAWFDEVTLPPAMRPAEKRIREIGQQLFDTDASPVTDPDTASPTKRV